MPKYYLSFSISPVQDFVSAARTTRDLWTGSYLLSWLTGHAIKAIGCENLILPSIFENHPLLEAINGKLNTKSISQAMPPFLVPTIPNTFIAKVDDQKMAKASENAVRKEWLIICESVHQHLKDRLRSTEYGNHWDAFWNEQVENYWDIQVVTVPIAEAESQQPPLVPKNLDGFQRGLRYLGRLASSKKQIRHFPLHEIYKASNGKLIEDTRPKCAMFGSMAQMGIIASQNKSQMKLSREFWDDVRTLVTTEGARLQKKDRLCAVALVKRFAWACYFKPRFNHIDFDFPDVDTICAAQWLHVSKIDTFEQHEERSEKDDSSGKKNWSGHWLRWKKREEGRDNDRLDGVEPCPSGESWKRIEKCKGKEIAGAVPRYYAALLLDGDKMGDAINLCKTDGELKELSTALGDFALKTAVTSIERNLGKLVFAGGDDVLALLPAEHALICAKELADAYSELDFPCRENWKPHCTVAIAIAHYKTPLHTVLAELRRSERVGKKDGGDCLALTIMRRSGEQTTNVVKRDHIDQLKKFVDWFSEKRSDKNSEGTTNTKGETDRWVYRFRQVLDSLPDSDDAVKAELGRLLGRAELQDKDSRKKAFTDFYSVCQVKNKAANGKLSMIAITNESDENAKPTGKRFAQLVQSTSFIARDGGR